MIGGKAFAGPLGLLALALILSVAARIPVLASAGATEPPVAPADGAEASWPSLAPVLAEIEARDAAVREREAALESRLTLLADTERTVEERLVALEDAEARLMGHIERIEAAGSEDIRQLTTVYEQMKPKEAVALFQTMTPEFAAGFLARMRGDAAAAILAGLDPQTAYAISVFLAGRNVPGPDAGMGR